MSKHRPFVMLPRAAALVLLGALLSCTREDRREESAEPTLVQGEKPAAAQAPPSERESGGARDPSADATPNGREEIIERGTGSFIGALQARGEREAQAGDINLRFQNTDVKEFSQVVLGDLLGVNYVIDPMVTGTVTIQTTVPITQEQLLPLFEEILSINGAALVRTNDLYRVVSLAGATRDARLASPGRGDVSGFRTQVIPLRFIAAEEMRTILESVIGDPSYIRVDPARNLIIASGSASEIQMIQDAIDVFDVDWLRGMSIGLYPLDNVNPTTLEAELRQVLAATTGEEGDNILGGLVRLVPLERLTSLLVVSSTTSALREVEIWIRRLDQPAESAGQRLYVYPVQNAKATELADILGSIFQSRSMRGRQTESTAFDRASEVSRQLAPGRLAPGLSPVQIMPGSGLTPEGGRLSTALQRQAVMPNTAVPSTAVATREDGTASTSDQGLAFTGASTIEIIADDVRNALVILASPQDYRMVESAIRKLDLVPLQVLIEASILEVVLRDDLTYGVEWFFRGTIDHGEKPTFGALDLGAPGISALAPGFSYSVVDNADQVRAALNLLASESEINVLSTPSLMVLDNHTATINVGDEIPVPARQATSNLDPVSPTVNEITFRQTGVTLSVTPRVNSSGLVTMEIQQQVASAATTTTSNIDAPTIQNREIESVVAINSGDTIVLGGLMQNRQSVSESGLPGLRRIPGLGKLFGQTSKDNNRTELLVLITPRVVRNRDDARGITEEFRQKLPQLKLPEPEGPAAEPSS